MLFVSQWLPKEDVQFQELKKSSLSLDNGISDEYPNGI